MATTTTASTPRTDSLTENTSAQKTPTSSSAVTNITLSNRYSPRSERSPKTDQLNPILSGTPQTPRSGSKTLSPYTSPRPFTGAAAVAEARQARLQKEREAGRQSSPNPQLTALNALMGTTGMSRASDAPLTSQLSEPMHKVTEKLTAPVSSPKDRSRTPTSMVSRTTPAATNGMPRAITVTATGNEQPSFVAEPGDMDDDNSNEGGSERLHPPTEGDDGRVAFTYPGPRPTTHESDAPARNMSMPGVGYDQLSPKSGSGTSKRHKCPYCSTDFTRHHNLKSHLLTHSQEKPYVCETCHSRFRRLHDLKRHTKLHTGERPHICPKCGRRFARGDALARHNKGPGGCAGRRTSFGGDDDGGDGGDDTMDGLEYQEGDEDRDDEEMLDAAGRRVSEPSRKRTHLQTREDANRAVYRQQSSTYPPPLGRSLREPMGHMGPPQQGMVPSSSNVTSPGEHGSHAGHSAHSSYSSQHYPPPPAPLPPSQAAGVFAQGSMTESPRPLSPGGHPEQQRLGVAEQGSLRNRSPSLTHQYQQQHYGRGTTRGPPTQSHIPSHPPPQLPSLPGLGPSQHPGSRLAVQHPPPMMIQQHGPPQTGPLPGSDPSSMSSHGHSSGGSMRDIMGHDPQDLWNYVRTLEQRFSRMQDEYELRISRLQEDLISLKGQVYAQR